MSGAVAIVAVICYPYFPPQVVLGILVHVLLDGELLFLDDVHSSVILSYWSVPVFHSLQNLIYSLYVTRFPCLVQHLSNCILLLYPQENLETLA